MDNRDQEDNPGCLLGCGIGYTLFFMYMLYQLWKATQVTEEILDKILPAVEYF
jgi:hypothetical protein